MNKQEKVERIDIVSRMLDLEERGWTFTMMVGESCIIHAHNQYVCSGNITSVEDLYTFIRRFDDDSWYQTQLNEDFIESGGEAISG